MDIVLILFILLKGLRQERELSLIERLANNKNANNKNVVIVNDDDGYTERHAKAPTHLIERLANNKNEGKHTRTQH